MDIKRTIRNWSLHMAIFAISLSILPMQKAHAFWSNEETTIDTGGNWTSSPDNPNRRSISRIPIHIYTDGHFIYIQNTNPYCDVTVTIRSNQTGAMEYKETFPEAATSYMVISIEQLSAGSYTLELTNPHGGYLTGTFNK